MKTARKEYLFVGIGRLLLAVLAAGIFTFSAQSATAGEKALVDFNASGAQDIVKSNGVSTSIISNGKDNVLEVTCVPSDNGYPGIGLKPESGDTWNLVEFSRVEAVITNTGDKPITVTMRVDNPGDWKANPWNGENTTVPAGKTVTASVTFGYSWGKPGFALDPTKVSKILVFTGKPEQEIKYRVEAIRAAGKAGEKP